MKAYRSNGNLVIEISEDALCDGTLQIPGNECKVTDRETYLNHVADNIIDIGETGDFNSCSSLTRLIDECVQHALDCGAGVEVEDWHNVSDQIPRTTDVANTTDSLERLSASVLFALGWCGALLCQ